MAKKSTKQQADEAEQAVQPQTDEAEQTVQQQTEAPQAEQKQADETPVKAPEPAVRSKFTGGAFANFFINLAAKFVILISLGILYPFMVTWKEKWMAKHTYINGRQLEFDGNGFQFWGRYMLWWLLSVVTLGIYYLAFMAVGVSKWRTKHLHFVDTPAEKRESHFDGRWYQLLGVKLLSWLVVIETLGIAALWSICFKQRWTCSHQVIDGKRLNFDGGGLQLFGKYMLWMLLTIITLGIYGFWFTIGVKKWVIYHTNDNGIEVKEKMSLDEIKEYISLIFPPLLLVIYGVSNAFMGSTAQMVQMMFLNFILIIGPAYIFAGAVSWFKKVGTKKSTTVAVAVMAIGWLVTIISTFLRIFAV